MWFVRDVPLLRDLGTICLLLLAIVAGCTDPAPQPSDVPVTPSATLTITPTATPSPTPTPIPQYDQPIVISELFIDSDGALFIELYNPQSAEWDLNGTRLMLSDVAAEDERVLVEWQTPAFVPAHGFYLLATKATRQGVLPDRLLDETIDRSQGALRLDSAAFESTFSTVVWGAAPSDLFQAILPVAEPPRGFTLARKLLPSGAPAQNSADSSRDFAALPEPTLLNSGASSQPALAEQLRLTLELPTSVSPGVQLPLIVRVQNMAQRDLTDVKVTIPFDGRLTLDQLPPMGQIDDGVLTLQLEALKVDATFSWPLFVTAPWYVDRWVQHGAFAAAEGLPRAFAGPYEVVVAPGRIPIAVARSQVGTLIEVAGRVTLVDPSDGWFYLEDESGGVRVATDDVSDVVIDQNVQVIGTLVDLDGTLTLQPAANRPLVAVNQLRALDFIRNDTDAVWGQQTHIQGELKRVVSIGDETRLHIATDVGVIVAVLDAERATLPDDTAVADTLTLGRIYQLNGVLELIDLEPRLLIQSAETIAVAYPPELRLELLGASNIGADEAMTHTVIVTNDSAELMTNIVVAAELPAYLSGAWSGQLISLSGNGNLGTDRIIYWGINQLEAGEQATVAFRYQYSGRGVSSLRVRVSSDERLVPTRAAHTVFIGRNVPIWAIQGLDAQSHMLDTVVKTEGVVTAVLPEQNGFVIQDVLGDGNPQTSDGIWVSTVGQALTETVAIGDYMLLTGRVTERAEQTTLLLEQLTIQGRNNSLPLAVPWDFVRYSADTAAYVEAHEGMRVALPFETRAIGPTSADGLTALTLARARQPTLVTAEPLIMQLYAPQLEIRRGDLLEPLNGTLLLTARQHQLTLIETPIVTPTIDTELAYPMVTGSQLGVVTLNLSGQSAEDQQATLARQLANLNTAVIGLQAVVDVAAVHSAAEQLGGYTLHATDNETNQRVLLLSAEHFSQTSVVELPLQMLESLQSIAIPQVVKASHGDETWLLINVHSAVLPSGRAPTPQQLMRLVDMVALLSAQLAADYPNAQQVLLGGLNVAWDAPVFEALAVAGLQPAASRARRTWPPFWTRIVAGELRTDSMIWTSAELHNRVEAIDSIHINSRTQAWHDPLLIQFSAPIEE